MARPKTPNIENRIIEAAARIFARKGFARTLMSDISAEAGIGKGTVYQYYKSKNDLFFAVFQWLVDQSHTGMVAMLDQLQGSTASRLKQCGHFMIASWLEMLEVYTLVFEFWSAAASSTRNQPFKSLFSDTYRQYRALVAGLLHQGVQSGEFSSRINMESVAASLVGTWDALLLQRWMDETFDPIAAADDFLSVVLKGLQPS